MALVVRDLARYPYGVALALQEQLVAKKVAGETNDYLLLVEHDPVYTLGRGADAAEVLGADQRFGVPVHRVSRGGGVTFHGPGQLVAYPILTLRQGGRDVHRYVRRLEAVLLAVCGEFGIRAHVREGLTGAWVGSAKIASVGIGVRRWTTFHGVALNVSTDLHFFEAIVPCRMPQVVMTSLAQEMGTAPPLADVARTFVAAFRREFGYVVGPPSTGMLHEDVA